MQLLVAPVEHIGLNLGQPTGQTPAVFVALGSFQHLLSMLHEELGETHRIKRWRGLDDNIFLGGGFFSLVGTGRRNLFRQLGDHRVKNLLGNSLLGPGILEGYHDEEGLFVGQTHRRVHHAVKHGRHVVSHERRRSRRVRHPVHHGIMAELAGNSAECGNVPAAAFLHGTHGLCHHGGHGRMRIIHLATYMPQRNTRYS